MLKKINYILTFVINLFVGGYIGQTIYDIWDYVEHPGLYATQSAPWYTDILFNGIVTVVVIVTLFLIKLMIRRKLEQQ